MSFARNFQYVSRAFRKQMKGRFGASMTGYALIVGLIGVVAIGTISQTGKDVRSLFGEVDSAMVIAKAGGAGGTGDGSDNGGDPNASPIPTLDEVPDAYF